MTASRFRAVVAAITAVGLGVRVTWVLWASRQPSGIFVDPARYLGYAEQIAAGNGMVEGLTGDPTAYYPPGYPWFVGIVRWVSSPVTDQVWVAVGLVQAVLGAGSVVLVAFVARRLAGRRAGVVGAAVYALYPNLVFHTGVVLGETLYTALFLAFLAVLLARPWGASFTTRRAFACGLLLGAAVLVRPISLLVIPVVGLCWLLARKDYGVALRWTAALTVGVAACVLPWTVRNAIRLDAFVPISTNTGDNLCIGHARGATGAFSMPDACAVPYPFLDGLESELETDRARTRIALRSIVENVEREPWLLWRRTYFIWVRDGDHDALVAVQSYRFDPWMHPSTEATLSRMADVSYWAVGVAGVAGLVHLVRRRHPEDLLVVGVTVVTAAVPLAFFGDSRFKVPVIPLLIIAAATLVRDGRPSGVDRRDEGATPSISAPAEV